MGSTELALKDVVARTPAGATGLESPVQYCYLDLMSQTAAVDGVDGDGVTDSGARLNNWFPTTKMSILW